ncbi:MAG: hypothetical protein JSW39_04910 [Desulfobacterales bacterium]|nr:MAG: hypothetical protein JSW39_04910 [Desulfobacterales bacterium]
MRNPTGTPVPASNSQNYHLDVHTTLDRIFHSPVKLNTQTWFRAEDAAALGRIRLRRGQDDFQKIYRFTQEGVYRRQREPHDRLEAQLTPAQWTDVKETFYAYDLVRLGCPQVSEASLLIYIVSAAAISQRSESLSLCVFGKRQLHWVRLRADRLAPLEVSYVAQTQEAANRKNGTVKALRIALETQPLDSELDEVENFSFLGFQKEIAIDIDPTSRIPLHASGIIPGVGKVSLALREVRLKPATE